MPSRIWVDTSGVALAAALDVPRIAIKVNDAEAGEVLGCMVKEPTEAVHAARSLRRQTQSDVVVTLGACGAILLTDTGSWYVQPPAVPMVSAVGSGDAFLAALVMALAVGVPRPTRCRKLGLRVQQMRCRLVVVRFRSVTSVRFCNEQPSMQSNNR